VNLSVKDLEACLLAHILPHLPGQGGLKIDYFSTAKAYQMVMLHLPFGLIMVVLFGEVPLLDQAKLLEKAKGAINRGQTETRLPLLGAAIEFVGIEVPLRPMQKIEEQPSLVSNSLPF